MGFNAGILLPKGSFAEGKINESDIPYATPGYTYSGNLHIELHNQFGFIIQLKKQSLESKLPGSIPVDESWDSKNFLAGLYKQFNFSDSLKNGLEISTMYGIAESSPPLGMKSTGQCYNICAMLYFEAAPEVQIQLFTNYFYAKQDFVYSKNISITFPYHIEYNTYNSYDIEFQTLSIGLGIARFF